MLSNLNSCHGVFIPTPSIANGSAGAGAGGGVGSVSSSTRHYRSHWHYNNHSTHNETKRNKRPIIHDSIWTKIEEDFTPELLEEQKLYNIPETVQQSPKQTSSHMIDEVDDGSCRGGDSGEHVPAKKMSALFIKPETDVECLYRKSGIREKCEVCASDVVLTDHGVLTC